MNKKSFKSYVRSVSDYLNAEYIGKIVIDGDLTIEEKSTIKNIILDHFMYGDSFANAANLIVEYLRGNRKNFQA